MSDDTSRPVIVVGVDGSDLSRDALRWAVQQARLTNAEVHAILAWDIPATGRVAPVHTERDYQHDAQQHLDGVVDKFLREDSDVAIRKQTVQQRPALALVQAAQGAELLVIGGHGRGRLPGPHLGSVASHCVHHASCPVLVVRGQYTGR